MTRSISKSTKTVASSADTIWKGDKAEKVGIYIKLDHSVVEWFKGSGPGYQRRINEVLKRFVGAVKGDDVASERVSSRLEIAQELYERYHERCFWYMKQDLIVTNRDLPEIIKGLKTYGGRSGYLEACKLCL